METKKFHFQGTLLVPSKNIETSLNFFWAGSLKAENNEVLSSLRLKTKMNLFRFWKRT